MKHYLILSHLIFLGCDSMYFTVDYWTRPGGPVCIPGGGGYSSLLVALTPLDDDLNYYKYDNHTKTYEVRGVKLTTSRLVQLMKVNWKQMNLWWGIKTDDGIYEINNELNLKHAYHTTYPFAMMAQIFAKDLPDELIEISAMNPITISLFIKAKQNPFDNKFESQLHPHLILRHGIFKCVQASVAHDLLFQSN